MGGTEGGTRGGSPVLEGDYFRIDSGGDFAAGDRLVRSESFCGRQEIRFVDFGSGSRLRVLLERPRGAAMPSFSYVAYSEAGAVIVADEVFTADHLLVFDVGDLVPGGRFGSLVFDFTGAGSGHVTGEYSAFGRFSVELDGACRAPAPNAGELIVPGFEVEIASLDGPTTFFAVRNTSDEAVEVDVAYHGDRIAVEPLRTDVFTLGPRQTLTRDVRGDLSHLDVSGGFAGGLIVITETGGDASALEGDYFRIDGANDFAAGDRLVRSTDFCTRQETRFVEFGSGSRLRILLAEPRGAEEASFSYTAYDEAGTMIAGDAVFAADHLVSIAVDEWVAPQRFGSLVFDFSNAGGGLVTAEYSAFGRFTVEPGGGCGRQL